MAGTVTITVAAIHSAEAVGVLSGKPAIGSTASHAVEPPPWKRECSFSLFCLILTRALAQAITLGWGGSGWSGDVLEQLGPGNNIPREPPSSRCGSSENLFSAYKGVTSFGKVYVHSQKSVPRCILGIKELESCLNVSNPATVLPMIHRCGIFTGATTAGLYISFSDEGMITAAIWNSN